MGGGAETHILGNASIDAFTLILHKEDDVQSVGSVSSVPQLGKILLTLDFESKAFCTYYRCVPSASCSILFRAICGKSRACRTDLGNSKKENYKI